MVVAKLSEEQRGAGAAVVRNLLDIERAYLEVAYALALFEVEEHNFAVRLRNFELSSDRTDGSPTDWLEKHWMFLAARYGGLAVRNFGQALAAVSGLIGRVPSWNDYIDRKGVGIARKRFSSSFPTIDKVRHAVAHPELYSHPNKAENMRVTDDLGTSMMMQSNLEGRKLSYTFDGMIVSYELSLATLKELLAIMTDCYSAFHAPRPGTPKA